MLLVKGWVGMCTWLRSGLCVGAVCFVSIHGDAWVMGI